ncbi:hypothetical protein [Polaribacter sp. Hel_I_88]|uniref:hypothetical protein n=1 Tax=Polaribacter sp. Hel_I_88 TaxID=1250006 RepID=UPI000A4E5C95|nr:hypothetical protein [Polaribacter sp. Hel_I_88]
MIISLYKKLIHTNIMIKKVLTGNTQTVVLEGLERPESLIFNGVHINTTIKVEIQRVGEDNTKVITLIPLARLHEAQQKIIRLRTGNPVLPVRYNYDNSTLSGIIIQLSIGGEIPLSDVNDKIIISLANMSNPGGSMFVVGSGVTSNVLYRILDQNYEGKNDELRLPVDKFDFLIFDKSEQNFPQQIEKFYENDVDREDFEQILLKEQIKFGCVAFATGLDINGTEIDTPVFGSYSSIVIDVTNLQTLLLKDDRGNDYKFHGVKFE